MNGILIYLTRLNAAPFPILILILQFALLPLSDSTETVLMFPLTLSLSLVVVVSLELHIQENKNTFYYFLPPFRQLFSQQRENISTSDSVASISVDMIRNFRHR